MNLFEMFDSDPKLLKENNEQIFDKIYAECQPYLNEIGNDVINHTMYRGTKDKSLPSDAQPHSGIKKVRKNDRTPVDTPVETHDELNDYFTKKFGHPFRNGLFTANIPVMAKTYGPNIYAIFPIGQYEYVWSPTIVDLYSEFLEDQDQVWLEFAEYKGITIEDEGEFTDMVNEYSIFDLIDMKGGYTNKDITKLLASPKPREIMLWTDEYYFIKADEMTAFQEFLDKK